ncbi:unnamed protein product [Alopecurus aequalis]
MLTNELSIKLLINTQTNKVCFAEASSDVVDFLTALLSLPLGTITSLLSKEHLLGSVGTLLSSMEKLGAKYNNSERNLIPAVAPATLSRLQLLLSVQVSGEGKLYRCAGKLNIYSSQRIICGYVSVDTCSVCPSCHGAMNIPMTLTGAGTNAHTPVVVAAAAGTTTLPTPTYTVKDDLSVVTLLAKCGVKDLSVLQEKIVKIGKEEALGILGAAFKSKTVLTDVFLPKKNARCKREAPKEAMPKKNARCKKEAEEVIHI